MCKVCTDFPAAKKNCAKIYAPSNSMRQHPLLSFPSPRAPVASGLSWCCWWDIIIIIIAWDASNTLQTISRWGEIEKKKNRGRCMKKQKRLVKNTCQWTDRPGKKEKYLRMMGDACRDHCCCCCQLFFWKREKIPGSTASSNNRIIGKQGREKLLAWRMLLCHVFVLEKEQREKKSSGNQVHQKRWAKN